jgi:hypothetical protein
VLGRSGLFGRVDTIHLPHLPDAPTLVDDIRVLFRDRELAGRIDAEPPDVVESAHTVTTRQMQYEPDGAHRLAGYRALTHPRQRAECLDSCRDIRQ